MAEPIPRGPIEMTLEEFWEKWKPQTASARTKADFIVDLERVILTRMRDLGVFDADD